MTWLTEIVSGSTKIFINKSSYLISEEIIKQLQQHATVQVVGEDEDWDVAIYLVGYGQESWEEFQVYTTGLHQTLDKSLRTHAKFLLVIPDVKSAFGKVAKTIVEQFGKNFGLSYLIVETKSVSSTTKAASQIVNLLVGESAEKESEEVKEKPKTKKAVGFWLGVLLIVLSPWILLGGGVGATLASAYCLSRALQKTDWLWSVRCAQALNRSSQVASALSPLALGYPIKDKLDIAHQIGEVVLQTDKVVNLLHPYAENLLGAKNIHLSSDVSVTASQLSILTEQIADLQIKIQGIESEWQLADTISSKLDQARKISSKVNLLVPQLPQLLSLSGQSQWLVLVQDNTELRPTGGFVDSIGLVTLEDGHITNARFLPTADADAQLKGQVEPPIELKNALGEASWHLRDSNWDPNFPSSAARAAWFVQKELGLEVDGVVAINLSSLASWLKVLGPVDLPDLNSQITSDNWLNTYFSQPSLDAPGKFSSGLAEAVYTKASKLPPDQVSSLFLALVQALETRQMQIWPMTFTAPGLTVASWDGHVGQSKCSSAYFCLQDYIYQADANVGINKVNPYIKQGAILNIVVSQDKVTTRYAMTYSHSGVESGWPMGEYKNYIRVYVPSDSQLKQVEWKGKVVKPQELNKHTQGGLTEIGLLTQLSPGETGQLSLLWEQAVSNQPRWHYQLELVSQSGISPYPVQIVINYPSNWWLQAGSDIKQQFASPGQIGYNSLIRGSQYVSIDWAPSN